MPITLMRATALLLPLLRHDAARVVVPLLASSVAGP